MSNIKKYPYLTIEQCGTRFYICVITAGDLSSICGKEYNDFDNDKVYQRRLNLNRVKTISTFIQSSKGVMPTAVVLNSKQELKIENNSLCIDLESDKFFIIDGQHRIEGAKEGDPSYPLCVVILNHVDDDYQSELFLTINNEQKRVNSNVRFNMMGNDSVKTPERIVRNMIHAFNTSPDSALRGMIRMDDSPISRNDNKLSLATVAEPIVGYIYNTRKHYELKRLLEQYECFDYICEPINKSFNQKKKRMLWSLYISNEEVVIYRILSNYFKAIKLTFPEQWNSNKYILSKTTGYNAIIMLFKDVFGICAADSNSFNTSKMLSILSPIKELGDKITLENYGLGQSGTVKLYNEMRERIIKKDDSELPDLDYSYFENIITEEDEEE